MPATASPWQTSVVSNEGARELQQLKVEYRRLTEELSKQWERSLAGLLTAAGIFAIITLLTARQLGAFVVPSVEYVVGAMVAWYAGVYLVSRSGRWGTWGRWISTCVDPLIPTAIMLLDFHHGGPHVAMSATGPVIYVVAVLAAVLRLDWRLCLLSGAMVSAQYTAIVLLLVRPAAPVELHALLALEHYSTVMKVVTFLVAGGIGALASRGLQDLFLRFTTNSAERSRLQTLFGMHVSEQVMQALLNGERREDGERRPVTVCFTDIRDFTHFCETRAPEDVVRFLNRYFERMCDVVAKHGGVVNKFMGDGMLILFGAPNSLQNDAASAYAAACEMLEVAEQMRASGDFPGLHVGIGLHRGDVVAASMGGRQRKEYTVVGDVVNVASRVQSLTRELGTPLLLTADVREHLSSQSLRSLGSCRVRGKQMAVDVFAPRDRVRQAPAVLAAS